MIDLGRAESGAAALRNRIADLKDAVARDGATILASWEPPFSRRAFRVAAANLAAYVALRRRDLREIQVELMPYGLSSLGRCESRVQATLEAVEASLSLIAGESVDRRVYPTPARFFRGERLLRRNTAELFGRAPESRGTRIIVTLESEAARDAAFVQNLIEGGMDCARINSAHDSPDAWLAMIRNVRAGARASGRTCTVLVDLAGPKMRIERVDQLRSGGRVFVDDRIFLTHNDERYAPGDASRAICSLPEIYGCLRVGDRVVIDEGRIGAQVEMVDAESALLRVRTARESGEKLRAEKGLNFPDSPLTLAPLTRDDYATLDAIAQETDMVGYSFVKEPADVALLQRELARRRPGLPCGIVLKIETARAVANLPALIVQSARVSPTAVMIARGDLAIEIGYRRLAEMQEEMLWVCEAASVPVVWATQVLDSFVKKGRRSRAEFTDAAMAERADCVMLNKGPFILEALSQIDDLLGRMAEHQAKKTSRLRALRSW